MTLGRRSDPWRSASKVLLGAVLATLLVAWPALPAHAHTRAVASWPAAGEVVLSAPDRVTVAFNGDLLPDVRVAVVGPDGASIVEGEPVLLGRFVTQELAVSGAPGIYTASVHVIADDMHTISGSFEFVVDPAGVATGNPAGPLPDLGLEDAAGDDPSGAEGTSAEGTSADGTRAGEANADRAGGPTLLLTGLVLALLLVVVIRVAGRRVRPGA
ncbi:copper resistance protein CopC [Nocardioides sp.]|uniref:copper resistance CopC family protein n=1 Tax=Nocardioides sp. TaxID=35761 RepID=UPI003568FDC2